VKPVKQIEDSMELKKTHAELEQRVEERTAESVKANELLRREIEERKRAEEALRESEEKYCSMMEAMNDPVYICSNDYRVTYMNPAMINRIGTSDIKGIPCYKLIHGLDEKCQWCVHDKIQKGEHSVTELISPKDGRVYHVSHSPVFHADNSISKMTIFRDITEYKHAEQALGESEERYRTLTEHIADGVTLVQNEKFLFVNNAFVSMFGYTNANQILGKRAVDLISSGFDQGIKGIYSGLESALSCEKIFRAPCIKSEGREFWVEGHHNIIKWKGMPAILTTIRDITERRLQEIAIQDETERLRDENIRLRSSIKERYKFGDIIGKSRPMQEIYELILKAANSDANVVICGESGTGKEMVARAIHDMSNRRDKVFVAVNCGAIPETLLESEFFGYKKGAFTGANMDKHGYLDLAGGGTLFLDEVSELDLNLQVKLLRVIDGGGYTPVGSNKAKYSDFRIIAATNKNLLEQVNKNLMREDFFYRMHVIPVTVPPLRERKEDIPLLVEHFLKLHCDTKERQSLPVNIFEAIDNHDWPGNVRELENVLKRYVTIQCLDFINPRGSRAANEVNDSSKELLQENTGLRDAVEFFEKDYIARVLDQNCWHRGKTAKTLGIPERTLYRKLKQFQLTRS
jgi:PAS domain S-box-containing protein